MVTLDPRRTLVPADGFVDATGRVGEPVVEVTTNPAFSRIPAACCTDRPVTSGTVTSGGPRDT